MPNAKPKPYTLRAQKGARKDLALCFGIGSLLGVLVFLLIYGPSTLNVTYDSWIYAGYIEQDVIQRYAGWLYYRAAGWGWPLTVANNLSVPYGASIVFTDSLPLVAILCKALSPVLPQTFQYFGWVNLCNFALQGGFACLLLRHFNVGRVYMALASLVFLLNPIFIERAFRHDALGSQWIILAALWLYFVARQRARFPLGGFFALCVLSVGVHTYFTPMVFALLLAALLGYAQRHRRWGKAGLMLAICLAGTLVIAYVLGLITRGGDGGASGFGEYSMNLNALYNPSSFDWYAANDKLAWSSILPVQPQNYHQYDGFNYLGFGVLLALAALCVYGAVRLVLCVRCKNYASLHAAWAFCKSHLWLLLVCVCLTVFSFSNVVVFNTTTLYEVPLPDFLLQLGAVFRSSGRMFWPVNYLISLSLLVFAARRLHSWGKYAAVGLLVALQLADYGGVLVQKHQYFAGEAIVVEDEFTSEGWQFLAENYDTVLCLGNIFDYQFAVGFIRYNSNVTTNIIVTNRGGYTLIEDSYAPLIQYLYEGGEIEPGVLYVAGDEGTFNYIREGLHADIRGYTTGQYYAFGIPVAGNSLEEYLPIWMEED